MPRAVWNETVIAESDDVEVVDGYTYFPADAVDRRYLRDSDHRSVCPWKGTAWYYDIVVGGEENLAAAWYYPDPSQRAAPASASGEGCRSRAATTPTNRTGASLPASPADPGER